MLNLEHWQETERGGFPCLEVFHVVGCPQLRQIPHNSLTNLKCLIICACERLVSLPRLPSLKQLTLKRCERLVSLPQLPSLKELTLEDLGDLEEWCDVGEAHFPHLQTLTIRRCPKLKRWPSVLPVVARLKVLICEGFEELPVLPSLCQLSLSECNERVLESLSGLTSLPSLKIHDIPSLTSMPRGIWQALTQLKDLEIRDCTALEVLVDGENGLQDESLPSTLNSLRLFGCPYLKSLPKGLHALTSLRTLIVDGCPGVTSLPEEGLPTALRTLWITGCPVLEEKCKKDGGEDWPKISHIPDVTVSSL